MVNAVLKEQGSAREDVQKLEPLVVIRPKNGTYITILLTVIAVTLFAVFFVLIPVVAHMDFAAVWPVSDNRYPVKVVIFFSSLVWIYYLPRNIPWINTKEILFLSNMVIVYRFIPGSNFSIKYDEMCVDEYSGNRVGYVLTRSEKFIKSSINYSIFFTSKYLNCISLSLKNKYNLYDLGNINKAMKIIKNNVSEYNLH